MNKSIIRYCDTILAYGLPMLGFFITIAVYPVSFYPLYVKTLLLHIGTAVIGTVWLIKRIELHRIRIPLNSISTIIPAALFMVSALMSYFLISPYKTISLEELFQRIPYFIIFLIASTEFMSFDRIKRALFWLAASAALAGAVGILQHLHIDLFKLKGMMVERIPSTFGNPNFYVGFLALTIPVLYASFDFSPGEKRRNTLRLLSFIFISSIAYYILNLYGLPVGIRYPLLAVLFLVSILGNAKNKTHSLIIPALILQILLLNLLLTSSRSGQIALASGLISFSIFLHLAAVKKIHALRRYATLWLLIVIMAGFATVGTVYLSKKRHNSVAERSYYLRGALVLIKQKPFLGNGIGTFKVNYPLIKPDDAWAHQTVCFAYVRNVYNEFLEIIHDEGIVGGLFFLWILAAVFLQALRVIKKGNAAHSPYTLWQEGRVCTVLAAMLAGIIALLISNMVSLNMRYVSTGYHFWYLLGITVSLTSLLTHGEQAIGVYAAHSIRTGIHPVLHGARFVLYLLLVCGTSVITLMSARVFTAGTLLSRAMSLSKNAYIPVPVGNGAVSHDTYVEGVMYTSNDSLWEQAIRTYCRVVRLDPNSIEARYFLGNAFNRRFSLQPACNQQWGDFPGTARTDFERALEQYNGISNASPHYAELDFELGNLYMKRGMFDQALHCYLEHKKYKPYFIKTNYALARCYCARREFDKAEEAYLDALDNNDGFTRANIELSAVYHMLSQPELEKEFFSRAFDSSPEYALNTAVAQYETFQAWDKAIEYQKVLIERSPPLPLAYAKLGDLYLRKNDIVYAIECFERASEYSPSSARYLLTLSNLYYAQGNMDAAKNALNKAIVIDPEFVKRALKRK